MSPYIGLALILASLYGLAFVSEFYGEWFTGPTIFSLVVLIVIGVWQVIEGCQ